MIKRLLILCLISACVFACTQKAGKTDSWPFGVKYEVFVLAFADGNGDGKGDLKGLTAKLDYIRDLGANGIWLMPIMPSPSYHKYDVTDYKNIHPEYGTLEDFKKFSEEARKRGVHVIIDLVLNHTGTGHPWFQSAMKDKNSPYREYYIWAKKDSIRHEISKKKITLDSDNIRQWHEVNGDSTAEHYYGFFSSHMPDLNFDNQKVRDEMVEVARFWIEEMKVDGFRFDAARHIYPDDRAHDSHQFWLWYREQLLKIKPDIYMVGEVYSTDRNEVSPYAKGLPAVFNFDLGSNVITTLNTGRDTLRLIENYSEQIDFFKSSNPEFLDAPILTNHDQNRIMSQLKNDPQKAKTAASILLTLPGAPYLYYGEEIGMRGTKPDEFIREPFLWGDGDFTTQWITPRFNLKDSVLDLHSQKNDRTSLYNHYKNLIAHRNSSKPLTYGKIEKVINSDTRILAFIRAFDGEEELVLINISKESVAWELINGTELFTKTVFSSGGAKTDERKAVLPAYSTLVLSKN